MIGVQLLKFALVMMFILLMIWIAASLVSLTQQFIVSIEMLHRGRLTKGGALMSKKFYRIPKVVKNQGNEIKEFIERR